MTTEPETPEEDPVSKDPEASSADGESLEVVADDESTGAPDTSSGETSASLPPEALTLDRGLFVAALLLHTLLWWAGTGDALLDVDVANLTYGMREFNLSHFCPHPPGYLLYVLLLRGLHLLRFGADTPIDRVYTAQYLSVLFALGTVALSYMSARRLFSRRGAAGWVALFVALNPLLVFHSIDAQTHTSEAFAAVCLLFVSIRYVKQPTIARAVVMGILLAVGAAFRPSFVIFGVPWVTVVIGFRRFGQLVVAGLVSMVGAATWFVPTIVLSGGYEIWSSATNALVRDGFVATTSPLSGQSLWWVTVLNVMALVVALLQMLIPLGLGMSFVRGGQDTLARPKIPVGSLLWAGGIASLTTVVYYALTFFSEPGYVLALLPVLAMFMGTVVGGKRGMIPALLVIVANIAGGLVAPRSDTLKIASLDTWQLRHRIARLQVQVFDERLTEMPEGGRVLFVTDYSDITVGRQMPILRDDMDALLVQNYREPWFPTPSFIHVTPLDSVPVPDIHVMSATGTKRLAIEEEYWAIYIDERMSPEMQEQLRDQLRCPLEPVNRPGDYALIPIECLRRPMLQFDAMTLLLPLRPGDPPRDEGSNGETAADGPHPKPDEDPGGAEFDGGGGQGVDEKPEGLSERQTRSLKERLAREAELYVYDDEDAWDY